MKNKEFLKSLSAIADQLRRTIEAEVVGFESTPAAIAERRAKVFDLISGFEYFVYTYFPHYVHTADKSQLHEFLFTRLPEILREPKGVPEATGAPRGEGKSTMVTQLFTLYCIVTAQKHYCVIVMDSIDQAYPMLEAIKAELAYNPRLLTDFPEAAGAGRVWQAGTIVTANDIKVQVAGSGISMGDADITHALRDSKAASGRALDAAIIRRVPELLLKPDSVYVQTNAKNPTLWFIYETEQGKLVLLVDKPERKSKEMMNIVRTGGRITNWKEALNQHTLVWGKAPAGMK